MLSELQFALPWKFLTKRNKGLCLPLLLLVASQTPNRLLGTQGQTIKCLRTLWTSFCHQKSWKRICSLEFNTYDPNSLKGIPLALQSKRGAGSPVIYFPPTVGRLSKHLAATFLLPQVSAYHMEVLMSGTRYPTQRGTFRTELCNLCVKNLLVRWHYIQIHSCLPKCLEKNLAH